MVVTVRETPVSVFSATTLAPLMSAPLLAVTLPLMVPYNTCATNTVTDVITSNNKKSALHLKSLRRKKLFLQPINPHPREDIAAIAAPCPDEELLCDANYIHREIEMSIKFVDPTFNARSIKLTGNDVSFGVDRIAGWAILRNDAAQARSNISNTRQGSQS